jgi:hypothetical protein
LPSLTVLLATRRGWTQPRVVIGVALSIVMVIFLMQLGGRRIIGMVVGAALVSWMLTQKRLRPKLVIGTVVAIALLVAVMEVMLQYRGTGLAGLLNGAEPDVKVSNIYLRVDDNFLRLSQETALFPDVREYVGLRPLFYALARPIPRVVWPGKPTNAGYDLPTLIRLRGSGGTSLSQSIVGELYAMNGLIAVFLGGLFFGVLGRMWSKILEAPSGIGMNMIYGLGIMDLFIAFRSMQEFVLMSYPLLGWLVVAAAVRWFRPNRAVPAMHKMHITSLPDRRFDH